eukprot:968454-Prymnesium_polylepis.1
MEHTIRHRPAVEERALRSLVGVSARHACPGVPHQRCHRSIGCRHRTPRSALCGLTRPDS